MGKRVLITGSSKGLGRAIALEAAKAGFDISVHYNRDRAGAEETVQMAKEYNVRTWILGFDVCNRKECREILEQDVQENGPYYGVVCNAGVVADNAFPSISPEDWDKVVHTNLDGFYNVLHPLVMPMVRAKKGGRIITLSSVSGIMGNRGQVNYSASKAGIIGATKALAVELGKRNITVNCIAPGVIESDMTKDLPWEHVKDTIPLRRPGQAGEVGALAAFLLSDGAAYISRQVISVNGGMI